MTPDADEILDDVKKIIIKNGLNFEKVKTESNFWKKKSETYKISSQT